MSSLRGAVHTWRRSVCSSASRHCIAQPSTGVCNAAVARRPVSWLDPALAVQGNEFGAETLPDVLVMRVKVAGLVAYH